MSHTLNIHHGPDPVAIVTMPGIGTLIAAGTAVPADGADSYAPSCIFQHTDASTGNTVLYVNTGSNTSAAFKHLPGITEQEALTAADGSTVDSTYGAEEAAVIANNVTRIGEIEAALQAIGLLPSA